MKIKKAQALLAEIEQIKGQADAEQDSAKKAELIASMQGKSAEFDKLAAEIEQDKVLAEKKAKIEEARKALEGKSVVEVKNPSVEDAQVAAFMKLVNGKSLSGDNEQILVQPERDYGIAGAVRLPDRLAHLLRYGKTLPMTTANDSGAWIIPDYDAVLQKMPVPSPVLVPLCAIKQAKSGQYIYTKMNQTTGSGEWGGVTVSWGTEGSTKTATEMGVTRATLYTYELNAYTSASETLVATNAFNLEMEIVNAFKGAVGYAIDDAVINGLGHASNQPEGINVNGSVLTQVRDTTSEVNYVDLANLIGKLSTHLQQGAGFIMSQSVYTHLLGKLDGYDRPLFAGDPSQGLYKTLLGFPFVVSNSVPALGNDGDIFFANLQGFYLPVEREMVISSSDQAHDFWLKNLRGWKVHSHVGGKVVFPRYIAKLLAATS